MGLDPAPASAPSLRIGRSFVALLAGEIVNKAARFAAAIALARSLRLDEFGIVNVGIAVAGITLVLTSLGLPDLGARDLAVAPARLVEVARAVISARVAAVVLLGGTLVAAITAAGVIPVEVAVFVWLMSCSFALSADWALRGLERMPATATSAAVGGLVVLFGALFVIPAAPSAALAMAAFAAGEAAAAACTWWAARITRSLRPSLAGVRPMLRRSWPLALSAMAVYLYIANLDVVLLSIMRSDREAGLYSAPYRVFLAFSVIAVFVAYAVLPVVTQAVAAGHPARARALLRRLALPLAGFGIAILGAVELAGGPLLRALFGAPFGAMKEEFVVLCLALPWYCVGFPVGYALIGFGRNHAFLAGAGAACIANVALNLALIPAHGAMGAAIATVSALVVASLTWLALLGFLSQIGLALALLLVASAGAAVAASSSQAAETVGAVMLALGLGAALLGLGRLRAGR